MLFLFKERKESVKKEVVPHPPVLMHGGGGEGAGGTVHLLNRQPAHLNDTGNLKQTLGSPSQKLFFLLLLSMTKRD